MDILPYPFHPSRVLTERKRFIPLIKLCGEFALHANDGFPSYTITRSAK